MIIDYYNYGYLIYQIDHLYGTYHINILYVTYNMYHIKIFDKIIWAIAYDRGGTSFLRLLRRPPDIALDVFVNEICFYRLERLAIEDFLMDEALVKNKISS